MGAESGRIDLALAQRALEQQLTDEPFCFEFFQAVRLVERFAKGRTPVGLFAHPNQEVARFGVQSTLVFPASAIHSLTWREDGPPLMRVNFMGLTGPVGELPL